MEVDRSRLYYGFNCGSQGKLAQVVPQDLNYWQESCEIATGSRVPLTFFVTIVHNRKVRTKSWYTFKAHTSHGSKLPVQVYWSQAPNRVQVGYAFKALTVT
eukprot:3032189-Rhodomonas_salina.1